METRQPGKVLETQFMWLRVYFVLGARYCVNLHLFIDIIHDYCTHMIPLVHLKQVDTKKSNL